MPSLWWNVGMCFLMGAAAGGMLPVTYALLAETMPSRQRGWALVLVGGLGAVGGYLVASGLSASLQPAFGWRVMWFLNLPTGLLLILLNVWIPESPKFLAAMGRLAEAQAVLKRFGCVVLDAGVAPRAAMPAREPSLNALRGYAGTTLALSVAALAWGLVNFGLLLWLPAQLVTRGLDVALGSRLLAISSLIALPTIGVAALLYGRWSSKGALLGTLAVAALGLGAVMASPRIGGEATLVWALAMLLVGVNGLVAMLLPYAAESYPMRVRGRATGWVAACTKAGGLAAQAWSLVAPLPPLAAACALMLAPVLLALVLLWRHGGETRGSDLRKLERAAS
jgi:putative MFS transporter